MCLPEGLPSGVEKSYTAKPCPTHSLHARPFDKIDDAEWKRLAASGPVPARPLRVIGRVAEGADALTLLLEDPARHIEQRQAGQYLTLELPTDGERVRRAYSISSAPCEECLSNTVKQVPGGLASNWIHDHLPVDSLVRTFGPAGDFIPASIPADGSRHLLLIAGGSGVAPLAAIATQVLTTERESRASKIYGSAALERTIFAARLNRLANTHTERFSLQYVFETPPPDRVGATGRLDSDTLKPLLQSIDLSSVQQVMLCGPDGMRASVRQSLSEQGFDMQCVLEESFVSPRRSSVPDVVQQAVFAGSDSPMPIEVGVGRTLLEAALDAGVPISFSCCSGGCGACRVYITEGLSNVVLDEPNEISTTHQAQGRVPACLVRLKGPCQFELDH